MFFKNSLRRRGAATKEKKRQPTFLQKNRTFKYYLAFYPRRLFGLHVLCIPTIIFCIITKTTQIHILTVAL